MTEFLTVAEYAKRTHQTHQNIYRLIKQGKLTTVQQNVNGKIVKMIQVDTESEMCNTSAQNCSADVPENSATNAQDVHIYAEEIAELRAQLKAKDAIIEEYRQQVADYADRFFKLADQAQTLQLAEKAAAMSAMQPDTPIAPPADEKENPAHDPAPSLWDAIKRWWNGGI